jgi:hypothetical protein
MKSLSIYVCNATPIDLSRCPLPSHFTLGVNDSPCKRHIENGGGEARNNLLQAAELIRAVYPNVFVTDSYSESWGWSANKSTVVMERARQLREALQAAEGEATNEAAHDAWQDAMDSLDQLVTNWNAVAEMNLPATVE